MNHMGLPDMIMPISGQKVWFSDPEYTIVEWRDLNAALPNINRYNGGVRWSLLNHLHLVLRLVRSTPGLNSSDLERVSQLAVLHDLHEVYVGDMVNGLKKYCPDFKRIEQIWERYIHEVFFWSHYRVDAYPHLNKLVKEADIRAVVIEGNMFAYPIYCEMVRRGHTPIQSNEMEIVKEILSMDDHAKLNQLKTILEVTYDC